MQFAKPALFFAMALLFTCPLFAANVNSRCGSGAYLRKIEVSTTSALKAALSKAIAGDYIVVKPGIYQSAFVIDEKQGTAQYRIFICGEDGAIFSAAKPNSGYGLWVKNSSLLKIGNIEITGFLKGIVFDKTTNSLLYGMNVHHIAQEGIHFRTHSRNNTMRYSEVSYTGQTNAFYGEGVYVGSAESNWCTYTDCQPDKSDYTEITGNYIHHTGAESIDIKEGTSNGVIQQNRFEGSNMTGDYADSFIDVKGNDYMVSGNQGQVGFTSTGKAYQLDAFQVHVQMPGQGENNSFVANQVSGKLPGYIINVQSTAKNWLVGCDNVAVNGAKGISNKACQ